MNVARTVYRTLAEEGLTDEAVSRGLDRAVRALRDGISGQTDRERDAYLLSSGKKGREKLPLVVKTFDWVPYVHFGV